MSQPTAPKPSAQLWASVYQTSQPTALNPSAHLKTANVPIFVAAVLGLWFNIIIFFTVWSRPEMTLDFCRATTAA